VSRRDLTRLPGVRTALRSRWPQLVLRVIALAGFALAIVAGLTGTPVGSRNFAIVFVWIGWWALLMLVAVPLFGRGWCSVCPIPLPGEWLQQGSLLKPQGKGLGLGKRWPNRLRNIWLQNGAFVLVALFSTVILTSPLTSALVLAAFLLVAVAASLIFERRAFCRYLCPVGGFIGLYSQVAPVELRVIDSSVCAAHTEKTCYQGSAEGYGCPWQVFPPGLVKNTYCGTCMECLRTCPHDNLAINLRPFGADLDQPTGRKLDEAFKAFIMLGSALIYSAVMLGPWGFLKSAAYNIGTPQWLLYAGAFLTFIFLALPGLFYAAVALGHLWSGGGEPSSQQKKGRPLWAHKQSFIAFAYSLVPLGLAAWIAFSLSFVLANISYLWPVLSDPLGWGWNLLGTAQAAWTPYLTGATPVLQAGVLLGGLWWAARTALRTPPAPGARSLLPRSRVLQALPVIAFCAAVTFGLLGLLVA
jgi:polyferredoxin